MEVLKGPAVGPDGDRFKAGQQVPAHWPDWFVADLREVGHIVEASSSPTKTAAKRASRSRKASR